MAATGNVVGKVSVVQGQAFARAKDGTQRPLKVGDVVFENEAIVTGANGRVELEFDTGKVFLLRAKETVTLDSAVIGSELPDVRNAALLDRVGELADITRAIAEGSSLDQLLEETAAGLTGGGDGDGHSFVQLLRIAEALDQPGHNYQFNANNLGFELPSSGRLPDGATTAALPAGGNTAPIANAVTTSGHEDAASITIALSATDPDGTVTGYTVSSLPANGTLFADPALTVSVTAGATVGPLVYFVPAPNWSGSTSFNYSATDNSGAASNTATVSLGVTPVNDAPVAAADAFTTAEDSALTIAPAALLSNDSDLDGDTLAVASFTQPAHGTVALVAGNLVYTPDANYNGADAFTYTVSDGNGGTSTATVSLGVTPVNDAPILGVGSGSVTEDVTLTASGTLTISDPDAGESVFQAQTNAATSYGTFSVDAGGAWVYTLDNANPLIQALGAGSTLTDSITVLSADGTPTTVTITVNGANESATIGLGAVQEDVALTSNGTLTATGGATFVPASTSGAYGSLAVAADGAWTYTLDNGDVAVQSLRKGETRTENFSVGLSDGSTTTITITVTGTNDLPTIGAATESLTEDVGVVAGNLVVAGTLGITDPDAGEASFVAQPATVGTYGTFTLASNGTWTYSANNSNPAIQALGTGDTLTDTFTVSSADGTTSTVTVNITGSQDVSTITSATAALTETNAVLSTGGTLTVTDLDATAATVVPQTTAGTYGSFTIDAAGVWSYTTGSALDQLDAGQVVTETFTVATSDGGSATVTINITGSEDVSTLTSATAEAGFPSELKG